MLNGVIGDSLAALKSNLAIKMQLIGKNKTGKLCIFVHGLCATEAAWYYAKNPTKSYGTLLQKDLGFDPIFVRYNSGLHISTNGKQLAKLLSQFLSTAPVQEIIFFGHSMGGLVVRSACHYAQKSKAPWIKAISKIFLIGTPHHGNDYEKLGNLTTRVLKLVPNLFTNGIAWLGNRRSAGIKDLRFGNLLDEDWRGHDPDALWQDNRHPVPLLENVKYYIIAGSLAKKKDNIFTQYFGDGMVPMRTAAGRSFNKSRTLLFLQDHFKIIKGVSHPKLSRHPKVYKQIQKWCE